MVKLYWHSWLFKVVALNRVLHRYFWVDGCLFVRSLTSFDYAKITVKIYGLLNFARKGNV